MATAASAAQAALYREIEAAAAQIGSMTNLGYRTRALSDLALAFRYAAGGQQPGSVTVEK